MGEVGIVVVWRTGQGRGLRERSVVCGWRIVVHWYVSAFKFFGFHRGGRFDEFDLQMGL